MATVEERCRRMANESRTPGDARRLLLEAADAIKAAYTFAAECLAMTHGEEMTITITSTRKPQSEGEVIGPTLRVRGSRIPATPEPMCGVCGSTAPGGGCFRSNCPQQ